MAIQSINAINKVNIERKRGDTKIITFLIVDANGDAVDISLWTAFQLTVDPAKDPTDDVNNIFQVPGVFINTGADGKVGFSPPGTTDPGSYFYDVQAIDASAKKCTPVEGKYKLTQDITKD